MGNHHEKTMTWENLFGTFSIIILAKQIYISVQNVFLESQFPVHFGDLHLTTPKLKRCEPRKKPRLVVFL